MVQKKVVIIAPGGAATGGVELLHQLVNQLNEINQLAFICYFPFKRKFNTNQNYLNYNCPQIEFSDISKDDVVILPEVYTYLIHHFNKSKLFIWWLSVDNYINSMSFSYAISNRLNPFRKWKISKKDGRSFNNIGHLHQSEYARQFLIRHGITSSMPLSDYLNDDFIELSSKVDILRKQNVVAYNPAKGWERMQLLINKYPDITFIPIVNMSRNEVIDLLLVAKVYLDFGNHPGKDRIPREASLLGCCVVTNHRGSAFNQKDLPIPDFYKINDFDNTYLQATSEIIYKIFKEFSLHFSHFDLYRNRIKLEKCTFSIDVRKLYESIFSE